MRRRVGGKSRKSDLARLRNMYFTPGEKGGSGIPTVQRERKLGHQPLHYRTKDNEPCESGLKRNIKFTVGVKN